MFGVVLLLVLLYHVRGWLLLKTEAITSKIQYTQNNNKKAQPWIIASGCSANTIINAALR